MTFKLWPKTEANQIVAVLLIIIAMLAVAAFQIKPTVLKGDLYKIVSYVCRDDGGVHVGFWGYDRHNGGRVACRSGVIVQYKGIRLPKHLWKK